MKCQLKTGGVGHLGDKRRLIDVGDTYRQLSASGELISASGCDADGTDGDGDWELGTAWDW